MSAPWASPPRCPRSISARGGRRCRAGSRVSTRCWRSPTPSVGRATASSSTMSAAIHVGGNTRRCTPSPVGRWSGRRCWRARSGPTRIVRSLPRAGEQIARGLPIYPQGACRPIQIEFDFHSPVVFDTWASFAAAREAADDAERRKVYADPAFRARVKRQADGRGPDDDVFMGKELEGDTRRAAYLTYVITRRMEIRRCASASSSTWQRSVASIPST